MKKIIHYIIGTATLMMTQIQGTMAALPQVAAPKTAPDAGNYLQLIQFYALDLAVLVGLGIAVVAFVVVSMNVIGTYKEVQTGKKTWGDMGGQAVVGMLLIVAVVFLMNEASTILAK